MNREIKSLELTIQLYSFYDKHEVPSNCNTTVYLSFCGVIRWKDQSNLGMSPKEVEEDVLVINTSPTINQSWKEYTNTFMVKYKGILTGKTKAKKTTTCWTGITVSQEYMWW